MMASCGVGQNDQYACQADTPNLDRITASLDEMRDTTSRMMSRVHNIESEMQTEAMWAAVDFIQSDGWALSVLSSTGQTVHEWGVIADACVRPCINVEAIHPTSSDCRSVSVGVTGHVLCGSRERQ